MSDLRHDRTLRLMQRAFDWTVPPTFDALLEVTAGLRATVDLRAAGRAQDQLAVLALANVLGRLSLGTLQLLVSSQPLTTQLPPYQGPRLVDALEDLSTRLEITPEIESGHAPDAWTITVSGPAETTQWGVALDGSKAYLGRGRPRSSRVFDPVGCYTLASMVGGEALRAWARAAASTGAGVPGPRFEARAKPAADRSLDLHLGEWAAQRRARPTPPQPVIDWVSCGAVNQAALAALAAHPDLRLAGTVFDPGRLDAPDLNRSLLSFKDDLGLSKAQVGAEAVGGLAWRLGRYPEVLDAAAAPWIVCGTDDPSVRPACQQLWPRHLVVTATEEVFGYVAWHAPDKREAFCAACEPSPPLDGRVPIPTSAPTSVISGVASAALLVRLVVGDRPPHRTDLLTLRLDSPLAIDRTNPRPSPICVVCSNGPA